MCLLDMACGKLKMQEKHGLSLGLKKSRHIPRIAIHPTNSDIVYAGVMGNLYKPTQERGVYKSTDGGKTWKKTLIR